MASTPLPDDALPLRVQIPVRKQGAIKKGQWSTRVLTLDIATGTATVSRRNHPNNVLYHSLRVSGVTMWPRYAPSCISDDFALLEAKLTLRLEGESVSVPVFTTENTRASDQTVVMLSDPLSLQRSTTSSPSPPSHSGSRSGSVVSSNFSFTASDAAKQSRPLNTSFSWVEDAWMVQFTTFESFELALRMLTHMRNTESVALSAFLPYMEGDLQKIQQAWIARSGVVPFPSVRLDME